VGWSRDLGRLVCVRVVPPEDGQVMPETCESLNLNKV
jgi:hypothetical protein